MAAEPAPDSSGHQSPTTREGVFDLVRDVLAEQLGIDKSDIFITSSFQEDLDADSLDLVELIMELEDEFEIKITDEDAQKITTVAQAVDHLCRELGID